MWRCVTGGRASPRGYDMSMIDRVLIAALAVTIAACDRNSSDRGTATTSQPDSVTAAPVDSASPNVGALPLTGIAHGWLAASIGNVNAFDRSVPESAQIFEAELFPADSAAKSIKQGDTLRIVTSFQTMSVPVTEIVQREQGNGVEVVTLRVHAPGLALGVDHAMAWVTRNVAPPVAGVVLSSVSRGDTARIWMGDAVRFYMLENPIIAEIVAVPPGGAATPIVSVKSNPEGDRANGFERDSVLDYRGPDPRIPDVLEGFRFGERGPWLFVVLVYGYECMNYRLVEVVEGSARLLEEPLHYYSCVQ